MGYVGGSELGYENPMSPFFAQVVLRGDKFRSLVKGMLKGKKLGRRLYPEKCLSPSLLLRK